MGARTNNALIGGLLVATVCAGASIGGTACSGDPPRGPSVNVELFAWAPSEDGEGSFERGLETYPNATSVGVKLTQPLEGEVRSEPKRADLESGTLKLPELSFGEDLRLDFDLIDGTSTPAERIATGATPLFVSSATTSDRSFRVQVSPLEDFAPVGGRFASDDPEKDWEYEQVNFDDRSVSEKYLGRSGHRAVQTSAGKILVVGGGVARPPSTPAGMPGLKVVHDDLQRFEPKSGYISDLSFDETTGEARPEGADRLEVARAYHTVTPVGENRYLVIGGLTSDGGTAKPTASIEMIDLDAKPGERVRVFQDDEGSALALESARAFHTATYRPADNHVVVAGGMGEGGQILQSVELVDLENLQVVGGFKMSTPRAKHEAVLMDDANQSIWILGGVGKGMPAVRSSTELLVPDGNQFSNIKKAPLQPPRYSLAAVRTSKKILAVCGGFTKAKGTGAPTKDCQIGNMDRDDDQWLSSWELNHPRGGLDLVPLTQSQDIVVLGGRNREGKNVAEASRMVFKGPTASPPFEVNAAGSGSEGARYNPTVTRVSNGFILLTGGVPDGEGNPAPLESLAYYNPADLVRAQTSEENQSK